MLIDSVSALFLNIALSLIIRTVALCDKFAFIDDVVNLNTWCVL